MCFGTFCTVMDIEATQALDFAEYDDETDDEDSGGNKKPVKCLLYNKTLYSLKWLMSYCV